MKKNKLIMLVLLIFANIFYLFIDTYIGTFIIITILLYGVLSFVMVKAYAGNLQINFKLRQYSLKNKEIGFTVEIINLSKMPLPGVVITVNAKNLLTGENTGLSRELSVIPKGRAKIEANFISPHCGCVEISVNKIIITDPMKLFLKKKNLSSTSRCFIFPVIERTAWSDNEGYVYDMESFRYSHLHSGDDPSETFDVKEYTPGDICKSIHWKLSAKAQEIMVREPALPINNSLIIIDDKTFFKGQNFSAEVIDDHTELFLSLSYTAMLQGIGHSIGWFNCMTQTFEIHMITSVDDIYRIMPALLSAPCCEDFYSSADRFIMSDCEKKYGTCIYVSENISSINEVEKLKEYGKVKVYTTGKLK